MLETIIVILVVLWLAGVLIGTVGPLIHVLLVVALIAVILRLLRGRSSTA